MPCKTLTLLRDLIQSKNLLRPQKDVRCSIGDQAKTNANYITWIIFLKAEKSGAKEKKGGNPANAAAAGREFITGAVFFWAENHNNITREHQSYSAILKAG